MTAKVYAGDIKLVNSVTDPYVLDIAIQNNDLQRDETLFTACMISLYTDARNNEELDFGVDARGWWGDNEIGSRLWLLERAKTLAETLSQARDRSEACLLWMKEDGLVSGVVVTTERQGSQPANLQITVALQKPDGAEVRFVFQYFFNWLAQLK